MSVIVTLVATDGPLLTTVIKYANVSLTTGLLLVTFTVIPKSTNCVSLVTFTTVKVLATLLFTMSSNSSADTDTVVV